jgi:hypothetical protein
LRLAIDIPTGFLHQAEAHLIQGYCNVGVILGNEDDLAFSTSLRHADLER